MQVSETIVTDKVFGNYTAFSCDVIAAMLEGKNNRISLPWEIRSIFMQNCFIVSALQHGCRENPLYYTILYYAMLCYAILYYTILYYTNTILYCTVLY